MVALTAVIAFPTGTQGSVEDDSVDYIDFIVATTDKLPLALAQRHLPGSDAESLHLPGVSKYTATLGHICF